MDIHPTLSCAAIVGLALSLGACARGSDLDERDFRSEGFGGSGGKAIVGAGGAMGSFAGGRVAESGRGTAGEADGLGGSGIGGGTVGLGDGGVSAGVGGLSAAGGRLGQAGAVVLSRGGGVQGVGGAPQGSGGTLSDGTAGGSEVAAPVTGVGVHQTAAAAGGNTSAIPLNLKLENKSGGALDVVDVTIRYYFTGDGWPNPVGEAFYAGANAGANKVEPTIAVYPMEPVQGADHYAEIGFSAATLANNGVLEFTGQLHDEDYKGSFDATDDYSYTGLQGYNDRITVYVDGALSWGTEPDAAAEADDVGGAFGAGGADSEGVAGSGTSGEAGAVSGSAGDTGAGSAAGATEGTESSGGTSSGATGQSDDDAATSAGGEGATSGVESDSDAGKGGVGGSEASDGVGGVSLSG